MGIVGLLSLLACSQAPEEDSKTKGNGKTPNPLGAEAAGEGRSAQSSTSQGAPSEPVTAEKNPGPSAGQPQLAPEQLEHVWRLATRAVSFVEALDFEAAIETWQQVLTVAPNWTTARINLGIATLNSSNGEEAAMQILRDSLESDPSNPWANFSLGILETRAGLPESALARYQVVLASAPDDADALTRSAMLQRDAGQLDLALESLQRATQSNPLLLPAWSELSAVLGQLDRAQASEEAWARFEELKSNGLGQERVISYGKMGPYAEVIQDFDLPRPEWSVQPLDLRFAELSPERVDSVLHGGSGTGAFESWVKAGAKAEQVSGGVVTCDLNYDGEQDLILANSGSGPDLFALLGQAGRLRDASSELGFDSEAAETICLAVADFDGDAALDLFLGRASTDRLATRDFEDFDGPFDFEFEGPGDAKEPTYSAAIADLDQDGDLDLALGRQSGLALYRWAGEALERMPDADVPKVGGPLLSVLTADMDGDGDLDLITGTPKPAAWINDRLWGFAPTDFSVAGTEPIASISIADLNADGLCDWLCSSPNSTRLLLAGRDGGFVRDRGFESMAAQAGGLGASVFDADRDGDLDCLLLGETPQILLRDSNGEWSFAAAREEALDGDPSNQASALGLWTDAQPNLRGHVLFDLEGDGDLDLCVLRNGSTPLLYENLSDTASRPGDWISILPQGVSEGGSARALSLGIGARVEITAGFTRWVGYSGLGGGFAGAAPAEVHAVIAGEERAGRVRILWADGVAQNELDLAGGRLHRIEQHQETASSCPLIFAWTGAAFSYITDCLGGGGLGYLVQPGEFGTPDANETVALGSRLTPRDGAYEIRLAEPMEEATFLDRARLLSVNHPHGTEVWPEERFATSAPAASGRPLLLRTGERVFPKRAVSQELPAAEQKFERERYQALAEGPTAASPFRDDRSRLLHIDRDAAGPFALHRRLLGFASLWSTEFEFELTPELRRAVANQQPVHLYIYGWVEYPYSRLNYAAWQEGIAMEPWTLEARADDAQGQGSSSPGEWTPVLHQFGYPAGKPRMMTLDLAPHWDPLVRGDSVNFRLRSNLEVYLDQAFLAADISASTPGFEIEHLQAEQAEVAWLGFPREYSPDGKHPRLFDYANRNHSSDFKTLAGVYTAFGPALELINAFDDRFAVFGRGEEIRLRFPLEAQPAPEQRTWLLQLEGYCKDMCPQTAHPATLAPLPFRDMGVYPPRQALGSAHPSLSSAKNSRLEAAPAPVR